MIMMSADILDSGHVELWESVAALLINTQPEHVVFAACLKKTKSKNGVSMQGDRDDLRPR